MILNKKFFKKSEGKIIFSNEGIKIYKNEELFFEEEGIFFLPSKKLEEIKKDVRKFFKIDIFIEESYFKTFDTEAENNEDSEENIEDFINSRAKIFLEVENLNEYFIKFFKKDEKNYSIFILDKEFIEDLVEFSLKNGLKIEKIIISDVENYLIEDYNLLFKRENNFSFTKNNIIFFVFIIMIFSGIKIYDYNLKSKISELSLKIFSEKEELEDLKPEYENLKEKVEKLKIDIKSFDYEKEYFREKILKILNMMPYEVSAENIYYEKGFLNIKGFSPDENFLFDFLSALEKDRTVKEARYDYIIKKEKNFEFYIEIKVS